MSGTGSATAARPTRGVAARGAAGAGRRGRDRARARGWGGSRQDGSRDATALKTRRGRGRNEAGGKQQKEHQPPGPGFGIAHPSVNTPLTTAPAPPGVRRSSRLAVPFRRPRRWRPPGARSGLVRRPGARRATRPRAPHAGTPPPPAAPAAARSPAPAVSRLSHRAPPSPAFPAACRPPYVLRSEPGSNRVAKAMALAGVTQVSRVPIRDVRGPGSYAQQPRTGTTSRWCSLARQDPRSTSSACVNASRRAPDMTSRFRRSRGGGPAAQKNPSGTAASLRSIDVCSASTTLTGRVASFSPSLPRLAVVLRIWAVFGECEACNLLIIKDRVLPETNVVP